MGAAFADLSFEGSEYVAVKKTLAKYMGVKQIPRVLEERLEWFDPDKFDVEDTVKQLKLFTKSDKRKVLELIAEVHESDGVWDVDEDVYLRTVADAMGLRPKDYEDLAIQDLELADS